MSKSLNSDQDTKIKARSVSTKAEQDIDTEGVDATIETEDPEVDAAVDDIVKVESDTVLKAQDEAAEQAGVVKQSLGQRFRKSWRNWWSHPKTRNGTIAAVVLVVAVVGAVPFTRYNVVGLVVRAKTTVTVLDSKNGTPVSGAEVNFGGSVAETDANGKATLRIHPGSRLLQISKQYYQGTKQGELVSLSGGNFDAKLVALGRQVAVKVVNEISGKPVANAAVEVKGAQAQTNSNGVATVVLPSGATSQTASVSLSGFNTMSVNIIAGGDIAKNTFSVVPAGKIYFLSDLSGHIDVVKANLDGSGRQTVLAGTGSEDTYSTSLLASRDWKYLALLSKRSGQNASVYLIDTTKNDTLTTIDEGNATFGLVGWNGDRLVYEVTRNAVDSWQPGKFALKSFDATTGRGLLLDQTTADGTDTYNWEGQNFGQVYLMGDQVVYAKNWTAGFYYGTNYAGNHLASKQAELDNIGADGSGHKVIKTFALASNVATSSIDVQTQLYQPNSLNIAFNDGSNTNFYEYGGGSVSAATDMTSDKFYNTPYSTYLLSPSGNQTFWAEQRDGKNMLYIGDQDGNGEKQIASLSDYNTYGWFTDDYVLVSKSASELYIMPAGGGTPFKVTDYYKPAITYGGYGGGYGGL